MSIEKHELKLNMKLHFAGLSSDATPSGMESFNAFLTLSSVLVKVIIALWQGSSLGLPPQVALLESSTDLSELQSVKTYQRFLSETDCALHTFLLLF